MKHLGSTLKTAQFRVTEYSVCVFYYCFLVSITLYCVIIDINPTGITGLIIS